MASPDISPSPSPIKAPDAERETLIKKAEENLALASRYLSEMCQGMRRWSMSIPAREDDIDLVFGRVIRLGKDLLAESAQLRAELEAEKNGAEILDLEGMEANTRLGKLATLILNTDLVTEKGRRAKDYARFCLGYIKDDPEATSRLSGKAEQEQ